MANEDVTYILKSKMALPNKLLQDDGSITDLFGNVVVNPVDEYNNKPALPNKFLNPDGTYSTLNEIISGSIDTELFVIVEELPEVGNPQKIYLVPDGEGGFVEYHYVDDKWDPIGLIHIDLSNYSTTQEMMNAIEAAVLQGLVDAKAYTDEKFDNIKVEPQFIYWDGIKTNYAPFNEMLKCTGPVIMSYSDSYICLIRDPQQIKNGTALEFRKPITGSTEYGGNHTRVAVEKWTATITMNSAREVTNLYTSYSPSYIEYLDTNKKYTTAFIPTNPGHPATKQYVDDSIKTSITDALGGEY